MDVETFTHIFKKEEETTVDDAKQEEQSNETMRCVRRHAITRDFCALILRRSCSQILFETCSVVVIHGLKFNTIITIPYVASPESTITVLTLAK